MYERFIDRARKVMQLANQEAQRFNHEYIGTEHVLLGLIKEGVLLRLINEGRNASSGWSLPLSTANQVLVNLSVDLRTVCREVEKLVQSGPDMVTLGKLPQTPRAKKVIEYSMQEACHLNHNYVGTEHILLGLLREQEGVAAQVLMNLGLTLEAVREEVLNLLGQGSNTMEDEIDKLRNLLSRTYPDADCHTKGERSAGGCELGGTHVCLVCQRAEIEWLRVEVLRRENTMVLYVNKITGLLAELRKAAEWTAAPESAQTERKGE